MLCEKCGCKIEEKNEFKKLVCDKIYERCKSKFSKAKNRCDSDPRGINLEYFKDIN